MRVEEKIKLIIGEQCVNNLVTQDRLADALAEVERLKSVVAERDATIAELRGVVGDPSTDVQSGGEVAG